MELHAIKRELCHRLAASVKDKLLKLHMMKPGTLSCAFPQALSAVIYKECMGLCLIMVDSNIGYLTEGFLPGLSPLEKPLAFKIKEVSVCLFL